MSTRSRTRCVQENCTGGPSSAKALFNDSDNTKVVLVAIPSSPAFFHFNTQTRVTGAICLKQRFLKHQKQLDSGGTLWMFKPAWHKVSHVVSTRQINYNAPLREVPTSDNVTVGVDLTVSFRIKTDSAKMFVYKLGAARLDEYMSAKVEEGIRGLVYGVSHDQVLDLKAEFAQKMLDQLKEKFDEFGILIENCMITHVALPHELDSTLKKTTSFVTKMQEQEKVHQNAMRMEEMDHQRRSTDIQRQSEIKLGKLDAELKRYKIEHEEKTTEASRKAQVTVKEARARMVQDIAKAEGELRIAETEGEKYKQNLIKQAQIEIARQQMEAEEYANSHLKASEARLATASKQAKSMLAMASAEDAAKKDLAEKREYELKWKELEVYQRLAGQGRRLFTGDMGASVIAQMTPAGKKKK